MEELTKVPIIIANTSPFRIFRRNEEDKWDPDLEELNKREYDYVKLHRISMYLDVGIDPFSLGVGFDGSLILPATEEFRNEKQALSIFNKSLGKILLGGIYFDAVSPVELTLGELTTESYFSQVTSSNGPISSFHQSLRTKHIGNLDVIKLLKPKEVFVNDVREAYYEGEEIFDKIEDLSPSLILNGVTFLVRHQWAEALINIWTSVEQVIQHIWKERILNNDDNLTLSGRKDFLRDNRTWAVSNKAELLFQKDLLGKEVYKNISKARKSRNNFVHNGKKPSMSHAHTSLKALLELISLVISDFNSSKELEDTFKKILKFDRVDYSPPTKKDNDEITHWISLPPVPGFKNWDDEEDYEIIEDLQLKKLDEEYT